MSRFCLGPVDAIVVSHNNKQNQTQNNNNSDNNNNNNNNVNELIINIIDRNQTETNICPIAPYEMYSYSEHTKVVYGIAACPDYLVSISRNEAMVRYGTDPNNYNKSQQNQETGGNAYSSLSDLENSAAMKEKLMAISSSAGSKNNNITDNAGSRASSVTSSSVHRSQQSTSNNKNRTTTKSSAQGSSVHSDTTSNNAATTSPVVSMSLDSKTKELSKTSVQLHKPGEVIKTLDVKLCQSGMWHACCFDRINSICAIANHKYQIVFYEMKTWKRISELKIHHTESIECLEFSHNNKMLLSCSQDESAIIWDVSSTGSSSESANNKNKNEKLFVLKHDRGLETGKFNGDDTLICTANNVAPHNIFLWDVSTGIQLYELVSNARDTIYDLLFYANKNQIMVGSGCGTLTNYDVDEITTVVLPNSGGNINSNANNFYSSNNNMMNQNIVAVNVVAAAAASASAAAAGKHNNTQNNTNNLAGVTKRSTAKIVFEKNFTSDAGIYTITFLSPLEDLFLISCEDFKMRILSAKDASLLYTLSGHEGQICKAFVEPKRGVIISAGNEAAPSTLRLWQIPIAEWKWTTRKCVFFNEIVENDLIALQKQNNNNMEMHSCSTSTTNSTESASSSDYEEESTKGTTIRRRKSSKSRKNTACGDSGNNNNNNSDISISELLFPPLCRAFTCFRVKVVTAQYIPPSPYQNYHPIIATFRIPISKLMISSSSSSSANQQQQQQDEEFASTSLLVPSKNNNTNNNSPNVKKSYASALGVPGSIAGSTEKLEDEDENNNTNNSNNKQQLLLLNKMKRQKKSKKHPIVSNITVSCDEDSGAMFLVVENRDENNNNSSSSVQIPLKLPEAILGALFRQTTFSRMNQRVKRLEDHQTKLQDTLVEVLQQLSELKKEKKK